MQVGMEVQILSPGMEHGEETDFGAEMFGVVGNGEERCGGGAEENALDYFFVLEADGGQRFRDGEHHMEVFDGQ